MTIHRIAPLLLLAALASIGTGRATDSAFRLIVHVDNPTAATTRAEVSSAFLKKRQRWDFGGKVLPVDQDPGSGVRTAFSSSTLGRDVAAIKSFWQREFFSGRGTPPPELGSDEEVIVFVASNPGAIGYVSLRARLPSTVKVIEINP